MIVKLEDKDTIIRREKELMNKLSLNAFGALKMAEWEYIEQMKSRGEVTNE